MLPALFLTLYIVWLTTAQHTIIYDDENDIRCEDTCGCHIDDLRTQLRQVQNELQQQRQQIEELTRDLNQSSKSDKADCPSNFTYISAVNSCYLPEFDQPLSWRDAAERCKSLYSNTHLVATNNDTEQTAVVSWWTYITGSRSGNYIELGFWTAGQRSDMTRLTPFVWKLATSHSYQELPLTYTNWNPGEPNNGQVSGDNVREACLHAWKLREYQWNDALCGSRMYYVCEYDL